MDTVVHFKIPGNNKKRTARFYTKLFRQNPRNIPENDYDIFHAAIIDENNIINKKKYVQRRVIPTELFR